MKSLANSIASGISSVLGVNRNGGIFGGSSTSGSGTASSGSSTTSSSSNRNSNRRRIRGTSDKSKTNSAGPMVVKVTGSGTTMVVSGKNVRASPSVAQSPQPGGAPGVPGVGPNVIAPVPVQPGSSGGTPTHSPSPVQSSGPTGKSPALQSPPQHAPSSSGANSSSSPSAALLHANNGASPQYVSPAASRPSSGTSPSTYVQNHSKGQSPSGAMMYPTTSGRSPAGTPTGVSPTSQLAMYNGRNPSPFHNGDDVGVGGSSDADTPHHQLIQPTATRAVPVGDREHSGSTPRSGSGSRGVSPANHYHDKKMRRTPERRESPLSLYHGTGYSTGGATAALSSSSPPVSPLASPVVSPLSSPSSSPTPLAGGIGALSYQDRSSPSQQHLQGGALALSSIGRASPLLEPVDEVVTEVERELQRKKSWSTMNQHITQPAAPSVAGGSNTTSNGLVRGRSYQSLNDPTESCDDGESVVSSASGVATDDDLSDEDGDGDSGGSITFSFTGSISGSQSNSQANSNRNSGVFTATTGTILGNGSPSTVGGKIAVDDFFSQNNNDDEDDIDVIVKQLDSAKLRASPLRETIPVGGGILTRKSPVVPLPTVPPTANVQNPTPSKPQQGSSSNKKPSPSLNMMNAAATASTTASTSAQVVATASPSRSPVTNVNPVIAAGAAVQSPQAVHTQSPSRQQARTKSPSVQPSQLPSQSQPSKSSSTVTAKQLLDSGKSHYLSLLHQLLTHSVC